VTKIVSYLEFQQRVRQYRPSDLLPAIGATSIEFFESETWQKDRVRLPWALAEIAKTSIVSGNEYRSGKVEARDVFQLCSEYNALDDPLRQRAAGLSGTPAAFMVRMQYLQFPYQNSPFEEVARITALFEDVDSLDTKIVSSAFLSDAIGCTSMTTSMLVSQYAQWLKIGVVISIQLGQLFGMVPIQSIIDFLWKS